MDQKKVWISFWENLWIIMGTPVDHHILCGSLVADCGGENFTRCEVFLLTVWIAGSAVDRYTVKSHTM